MSELRWARVFYNVECVGDLSLGGACRKGMIEECELELGSCEEAGAWKESILCHAEGSEAVCSDGLKSEEGYVRGGRFEDAIRGGFVAVSSIAMG